MLKICLAKYIYKIYVSTDEDLESALESSSTETMLRKFFEGTSMRNDGHEITYLYDYVAFVTFFMHLYIWKHITLKYHQRYNIFVKAYNIILIFVMQHTRK